MLLTRKNSKYLLSLLDYAYKQGVLSAYDTEDERYCEDFVDKYKGGTSFGLLEVQDDDISWKEWRWTLTCWARSARVYIIARDYLDHIASRNYLWAVLPVAFEFYLKGVEEWLKYPNPADLEVFRSRPKAKWLRGGKREKKVFTNDEIVSEIQRICFERGRREKGLEGGLKQSCYDAFASTVWTLTRKLPPAVIYNKVVENEETQEELQGWECGAEGGVAE